MDSFNNLLISLGSAVRWLGAALWEWLGAAARLVDAVLNPVLSPLLAVLNPVCRVIGDGVYAALGLMPVWAGLTIASVLLGLVMLIAFRHTSHQAGIARAKDAIKANLLALKLYKDDLRVTFLAQWRLVKAVGRLQGHMLKPIAILALPMLLVIAQMGVRYQWRPLHEGEQTLIRVRAADGQSPADIALEPTDGLAIEVGPVPGGGEAVWRVRAGKPGVHTLRFRAGEHHVDKQLVVGDSFTRVSAERVAARWTGQLLHPVEPRIPRDAGIDSIVIAYPGRPSWFSGADWWLLTFFVISMAAALVWAPVFKVRF